MKNHGLFTLSKSINFNLRRLRQIAEFFYLQARLHTEKQKPSVHDQRLLYIKERLRSLMLSRLYATLILTTKKHIFFYITKGFDDFFVLSPSFVTLG